RLQIGVGPVQRVPGAVLVQRVWIPGIVLSHLVPPAAAAVDVVAEVNDEVQIFFRDAAERGEVSTLVVLARDECESKSIERRAGEWRRPRPAGRAQLSARNEPIPVMSCGPQSIDFG